MPLVPVRIVSGPAFARGLPFDILTVVVGVYAGGYDFPLPIIRKFFFPRKKCGPRYDLYSLYKERVNFPAERVPV